MRLCATGGAGKGNWGVPEDERLAPTVLDKGDPNYVDPEDEEEQQ